LFLHGAEGLAAERPWLELLALRYRVIAPWHPCYGHSPLIDGVSSVDDLAISTSISVSRMLFGGWVAEEMIVQSTTRFSHLVFVDPLGIKIGGREDRDITDMHGLPRAPSASPQQA
jgi:pimeloyl-ACP methyl ester carboxylesterase